MSDTASNKKLIEEIFAAAGNPDPAVRDRALFVASLADDAIWTVTGQYSWSHEFKGREAIQNGLMGHFRSFFAVRPRTVAFNFIAEGDHVVVEARGDNVTKAGLRYDNQYCMVWRIENGRIKEIKEYCDSALVERVLGPFPAERRWRRLRQRANWLSSPGGSETSEARSWIGSHEMRTEVG